MLSAVGDRFARRTGLAMNVDALGRPALTEREPPPPPAPLVPGGSVASTLRRNWKLIAAMTVIAALIGWIISAMQPARYRASALAAIAPLPEGLEANEFLRGVEVLERRTVVVTVASLASTAATRTQVAAGPDYAIEAAILPNTNLVRIDVDGGDGAQAAAIANRVPAVLNAQARAMFKYYGVTMVSPATRPTSPFLPRPARAIIAGILIGLFLGCLAAWAAQWRSASRSAKLHSGV
jgi:capsular polysaccharide biosynthesis protein